MDLSNKLVQNIQPTSVLAAKQKVTPNQAHAQFADSLKDAINSVNKLQAKSDLTTEALAKGQIDNLHDVMIASQKSSIALSTTIEVQTKVIDAYKQVMRMQI